MKKKYAVLSVFLFIISICCGKNRNAPFTEVNFRLLWMPQSQFAGYIVAKVKGFYNEKGLNVNLLPGGPDLKPHMTVASGTDQIGISVPNSVIAARSNNVPLTIIAQIFQDSANRYILKKKNKINDLRELRGKKIGLWLGGDEVEFVAMLKTVGMKLSDVEVIPQGFSVVPFLEDKYVLSQVTTYNELNLIRDQGYDNDKLQILSPKDYDCAILGDAIFCAERYLKENTIIVSRFLEASILGWRYCFEHFDEAVDIIVKYNPELKNDDQKKQLKAVLDLIKCGSTLENGIGYVNEPDLATAERILFESGQIDKRVNPKDTYNSSAWKLISPEVKRIK